MHRSVAPGFLLSTPTLTDPNFARTVVLVFHHDDNGALGLIVNRPTERKVDEVLRAAGLSTADPAAREVPVCVGGPVVTESGWVVFEGDDPRKESFVVDDELLVTGSLEVFKDLLKRSTVGRMVFALGYAGWSAGQLDRELEEGAWIPAPLSRRVLFETPFADRWKAAWAALGVDPNLWTMTPGDG